MCWDAKMGASEMLALLMLCYDMLGILLIRLLNKEPHGYILVVIVEIRIKTEK